MTEKQFEEIQQRYATLPSVGVSSQVRTDLAACIGEITRVGAPFEPEPGVEDEPQEVAPRATTPEPRRTSGARKK